MKMPRFLGRPTEIHFSLMIYDSLEEKLASSHIRGEVSGIAPDRLSGFNLMNVVRLLATKISTRFLLGLLPWKKQEATVSSDFCITSVSAQLDKRWRLYY